MTSTRQKRAYFETLNPAEVYWRDHHDWLKDSGYQLRPRFRPGWIPSWKTDPKKLSVLCEDSWRPYSASVIDAVCLRDKSNVLLKKINKDAHPHELEIGRFFTGLGFSPANHCVPLLETLQPMDDAATTIIVMPYLREYGSPRFDTFGEAVELFRQIFEGLQFMHHHRVAHRDCHSLNILMDGERLYPHGFHRDIMHQDLKPDKFGKAAHYTRTRRPVKYYLVDFGISRQYDPAQLEGPLMEDIIMGGDKSVPEHQNEDRVTAEPFATDIYYLGNFIRQEFLQGYEPLRIHGWRGFAFMEPLVRDMVQADPAKRPTIDEVVARFVQVQKGLSAWKLRARVVGTREFAYKPHHVVAHWYRRIRSVVLRIPALPVPSN